MLSSTEAATRWQKYETCDSDVFRQKFQEDIIDLLDLDAIRPHLVQTKLLTEEETERLSRQSLSSQERKQELTKILSQKGSGCVSLFLECLSKENYGNSGHLQLLETITDELDRSLSTLSQCDAADMEDSLNAPDPKRVQLSDHEQKKRGLMMNACVRYINLAALIPKLNKQALLTYEEERDITNDRLKVRERIIRLLECIRKKKDGWTKFLTALEEETTHKGHATLLDELKKLPSIESLLQPVNLATYYVNWEISHYSQARLERGDSIVMSAVSGEEIEMDAPTSAESVNAPSTSGRDAPQPTQSELITSSGLPYGRQDSNPERYLPHITSTQPKYGRQISHTEQNVPVTMTSEPTYGRQLSRTQQTVPLITTSEPMYGRQISYPHQSVLLTTTSEPTYSRQVSNPQQNVPLTRTSDPTYDRQHSRTQQNAPLTTTSEPTYGRQLSRTQQTVPLIMTSQLTCDRQNSSQQNVPLTTTSEPIYSRQISHPQQSVPLAMTSQPTCGHQISSQQNVPLTTTSEPTYSRQISHPQQSVPLAMTSQPTNSHQISRPQQSVPLVVTAEPTYSRQISHPQRSVPLAVTSQPTCDRQNSSQQNLPLTTTSEPTYSRQISHPQQSVPLAMTSQPTNSHQISCPQQSVPLVVTAEPTYSRQISHSQQSVPLAMTSEPTNSHQISHPQQSVPLVVTAEPTYSGQVSHPEQSTPQHKQLNVSAYATHSPNVTEQYSSTPSSPQPPKQEFVSYLRMYFTSRSLPSDPGKWAPKVSTRYINLALVERGEVNKVEADEFTQASIHGDIDDIIKQKTHMDIKDVATPIDYGEGESVLPKYILVEGAPGVGKTAFAWELSKRWGRGEILKDFDMVVLLRLREVRVQKIKSIFDLFFYSNREVQKAIAREVEQSQGERILFIFEGFDELPNSKRSEDYLLCQMLKGDVLPASSILVTTRHSASAFLSENFDEPEQHIQILGFTRDNITSYYESVLKEERVLTAFKRYLNLHPHILSAMYVPLHCAIVVEVFINSFDTQTVGETKATIPKTMTQLYYSLTKSLLMRYLKKHSKHGKKQYRIQQFDNLPGKVPIKLEWISKLAYDGLVKDKVIFTDDDIPTNFETLELMQSIPELYTDEGTVVSYNFIHLTLQEFLAAYYISRQEPKRWMKEFQVQKNYSRMKVMLRFLAGLTAFSGVRKKHIRQLSFLKDTRERREITVDGLHWLFEAQFEDSNYTATILGKSIVRIDCTWSTVSQFDCFVLGFCIARSKCKWELEMCECDIGEDGLTILTNAIKSNQTVKQDEEESAPGHIVYSTGFISSLRLRGNGITSSALCQLFEKTPRQVFTKLEELELGNNKVDAKTCDVLGAIIPSMPRLHSISLSGNPIGSGGGTKLLTAWSKARCRKLLSLFNTRMGNKETSLVADMIAKRPGIEVVFLGGCDVPTEVAEKILRSLHVERSFMKQLYIGGARFMLKTSKLLADVLKKNKSLEVVDLRYCKIDEEGGKLILDALKYNATLQDLMITKGNSLGQSEAEGIHQRFPQEDMMGPEL